MLLLATVKGCGLGARVRFLEEAEYFSVDVKKITTSL
jgi:hypothetical protein